MTDTQHAAEQLEHFHEHTYQQPGDCTPTRDLRELLRQAVTRITELEAERNEARKLAAYAYNRWPAPIFWQAAAQIGNPFAALPDWLTASDPASADATNQQPPDGPR